MRGESLAKQRDRSLRHRCSNTCRRADVLTRCDFGDASRRGTSSSWNVAARRIASRRTCATASETRRAKCIVRLLTGAAPVLRLSDATHYPLSPRPLCTPLPLSLDRTCAQRRLNAPRDHPFNFSKPINAPLCATTDVSSSFLISSPFPLLSHSPLHLKIVFFSHPPRLAVPTRHFFLPSILSLCVCSRRLASASTATHLSVFLSLSLSSLTYPFPAL